MNTVFTAPRLQRSLVAVYRFYDAYAFPLTADSAPVESPLVVTIPSLGWTASYSEPDATYRFSVLTATLDDFVGTHEVVVASRDGKYVDQGKLTLTLPQSSSVPPVRSDFLMPTPLWPTTAFRPPEGETAIRGRITSSTSLMTAGLAVEIWTGGAPVPPTGTPSILTNSAGEFIYRFPRLKGVSGASSSATIRVNGGMVPVTPQTFPITFGRTQILLFQRT